MNSKPNPLIPSLAFLLQATTPLTELDFLTDATKAPQRSRKVTGIAAARREAKKRKSINARLSKRKH